MIYAVAILAIAVFMVALLKLRIVAKSKDAISTSRKVTHALRDPGLNDDYKEEIVQQAAIALLGNFASITLRGAAALGLSYLVLVAAEYAGIARQDDVIDLLSSWEAIVLTTVILTAAWFVWNKR